MCQGEVAIRVDRQDRVAETYSWINVSLVSECGPSISRPTDACPRPVIPGCTKGITLNGHSRFILGFRRRREGLRRSQ